MTEEILATLSNSKRELMEGNNADSEETSYQLNLLISSLGETDDKGMPIPALLGSVNHSPIASHFHTPANSVPHVLQISL